MDDDEFVAVATGCHLNEINEWCGEWRPATASAL
jgi:hypothetical protein